MEPFFKRFPAKIQCMARENSFVAIWPGKEYTKGGPHHKNTATSRMLMSKFGRGQVRRHNIISLTSIKEKGKLETRFPSEILISNEFNGLE